MAFSKKVVWMDGFRYHSAAGAIVVTTGNKLSSDIGSALVSAMYGRSSELGLSNLHLRISV